MHQPLKTIFEFAAGTCVFLAGAAFQLYLYGFASMVDPQLTGLERMLEIVERMMLFPEVVGTLFAITLMGIGIVITVRAAIGCCRKDVT